MHPSFDLLDIRSGHYPELDYTSLPFAEPYAKLGERRGLCAVVIALNFGEQASGSFTVS